MKKLIIGLNFIGISLLLLTQVRADNTTYYSADGKVITFSEYQEACKKRAKDLAALNQIANKIDAQKKVEINKKSAMSATVQLGSRNETNLNKKRSSKKKIFSSRHENYLKKKKEDEQKQLQRLEQERLKRKFESEMPGLTYELDPVEKPSIAASKRKKKSPSKDEVVSRLETEVDEERIQLELDAAPKCAPGQVKIYIRRYDRIECKRIDIARTLKKNGYDIVIED